MTMSTHRLRSYSIGASITAITIGIIFMIFLVVGATSTNLNATSTTIGTLQFSLWILGGAFCLFGSLTKRGLLLYVGAFIISVLVAYFIINIIILLVQLWTIGADCGRSSLQWSAFCSSTTGIMAITFFFYLMCGLAICSPMLQFLFKYATRLRSAGNDSYYEDIPDHAVQVHYQYAYPEQVASYPQQAYPPQAYYAQPTTIYPPSGKF